MGQAKLKKQLSLLHNSVKLKPEDYNIHVFIGRLFHNIFLIIPVISIYIYFLWEQKINVRYKVNLPDDDGNDKMINVDQIPPT